MLKRLLELKPRDVPTRVALRNTISVVLPLVVGVLSGHVGAGVGVAVGALNTMFSDQPGPYRLRAQRMLLAATGAVLAAFVGSALGGDLVAITLAALAWGVGGGMLVALGPEAGRAGMVAMILLVVTAATPQPPHLALLHAALIFAGGLLQTALAVAAWPLQRYRPERHALATVFGQLAVMARTRTRATDPPPTTQAVQYAQELLHGAHRSRSVAVQSFRVLAEISERARVELLALGDLREHFTDPAASAAVDGVVRLAADVCEGLAEALVEGATPQLATQRVAAMDDAITALDRVREAGSDRRDARLLRIARARAEGLAGQLRSATRNADFAGSLGEMRAQAVEARLPEALRPQSALATLRANLTLSSVALRHSLRCGVCLALAVAAERVLELPHGYWIPMTIAIVLKPDFAGTFSFGLLRVAGTLAGLVLTTLLVHFAFDGTWDRLVLFALLCFGFRLLTTVNYGIGVALLTGLIVILMSFYGDAPGETMLPRAIDTVIGSAAALLAYALWPTWETLRLRPALAAMLEAYRAYVRALLTSDAPAWTDARAVARARRTNAQASLERLAGEPRHDRTLVAFAEAVFANGNRLARAGMALEAVLLDAGRLPAHEALDAFGTRADDLLARIAAAVAEGATPNLPSLRGEERRVAAEMEEALPDGGDRHLAAAIAHACDRLADSIDTLSHLVGPTPAAAKP